MVVILSSYCITASARQEFRWRPITSRVRLGSVQLSRAHRGLRSLARLPKVFARRASAILSVSVAVPHRRKNDCDETAAAECESETDFDGTVRDRPGKVDRPLPPRQRQPLQPQRSVLGENRPRRRKKIRLAPAKPLCLFWKSIRPQGCFADGVSDVDVRELAAEPEGVLAHQIRGTVPKIEIRVVPSSRQGE